MVCLFRTTDTRLTLVGAHITMSHSNPLFTAHPLQVHADHDHERHVHFSLPKHRSDPTLHFLDVGGLRDEEFSYFSLAWRAGRRTAQILHIWVV